MGTIDKNLLFYKIMNYPVPRNQNIFVLWKKIDTDKKQNNQFSRDQKNKYLENFIKIINQHWKLYKSLPFIKEIFLCNSISFNATKRDSDIDLFIITKKWAMRRARFFSSLFFKIHWLKRSLKNKRQKFCLSFYVTENNTNLYPIMIDKTDIYLTYRLAHLVPLYQESSNYHSIYQNNKRFWSLMPNHPQEYYINIWNKLFTWKTKTKKRIEFRFWWLFWKFVELIIKTIRIPILIRKTKKLWSKWKHIIISDKMLKFHDDIRKKISTLYKIALKR